MSQALKDKLLALQSTSVRGHSHRLAAALTHIEAALARGVSRSQIHQALVADGIPISFGGFVKALQRLRRQRDAAATPAGSPPSS